jgi:hypothetical protein
MTKFRVDKEVVYTEMQVLDDEEGNEYEVLFIEAKSMQPGGTSWYRFYLPPGKTFGGDLTVGDHAD